MEVERWRTIERLYHSALELERGARGPFLDRACAGDEALAQAVRLLLENSEKSGTFLEEGALAVAARQLAISGGENQNPAGTGPLPAKIGRYRILRVLGEGGMGTVYEAEQDQPRRLVALKVIKPGMAAGEWLWRFEHEAQALGRLQHPGISQIYEASTADSGFGPQPYFAMELIRGLPLHKYADAHSLDSRQRLALMMKICEAVNHAHQRGLIHRDLKPGNILVDEAGQPKILDFGVARLTGSGEPATRKTGLGQLVGTLAYMSPEQVMADPLEIDTRSDVYSLGVILYEILAGRLPYDVERRPLHVGVQAILEDEPAGLSSIDRRFRGDIETIVGKALEKDKARRYASAADLGADIRRYLQDEPITARPPTASYQFRKFARRRKGVVAGVTAVFVVLAGGVAVSTSEAIRANRAGVAALRERDLASAAQRAATEDRDRALKAEQSANSERNRAIAAEAGVREQRDRVLLEKKRADEEAKTAQAINSFLQHDLLAQASARVQSSPDTKPDPDLKVRTALDRAAARIQGEFENQPGVEASIRQTIGKAYFDLGVYAEAQRHWERALDLRREALGPEHPNTLNTMNDLADAYRMQGAYGKAEPLLTTVLETRRRVLGPNNPATLSSLTDLANVYLDQRKDVQAEPLLVTALEAQRRVLGPDDPDTIASLHDLAIVYAGEGKLPQAEAMAVQALDARRRVLGAEHPQTVRSATHLAAVYSDEGKFVLAEPLLIEAAATQRRVLGAEHSDTLTTMNNLALLYRTEGKYSQAEPVYIQVLDARRRVLGAKHINTLTSSNNLAMLYCVEGKFAQGENLLAEAVETAQSSLGENHPAALIYRKNLGVANRLAGKYAESEAGLEKVLEAQRKNSPEALRTAQALALTYRAEGKMALAEQLMSRVLESRRGLAAEGLETVSSMSDLGALYQEEGKSELAEPLLAKALEIRRGLLGASNPDTLGTTAALAEVKLRQERFADAEALLHEALGAVEETSPDDWMRGYLKGLTGASLAGQRKYADAEPLLVSGYENMVQRASTIPADRRSLVQRAGARIVELYVAWGKTDAAEEWRRKLR